MGALRARTDCSMPEESLVLMMLCSSRRVIRVKSVASAKVKTTVMKMSAQRQMGTERIRILVVQAGKRFS